MSDPSVEGSDKTAVVEKGTSGPAPESAQLENRRRTVLLIIVTVAALLALAYGAFHFYDANHKEDPNIVQSSGRIESPETYIAAPTATRVLSVAVKEGDAVRKGQVIVVLDSGLLRQKIEQSAPALKQSLHAKQETDAQVAAVQQQIDKARAKSKGLVAKIFSTKGGREKQEMQLRTEMMEAKMMSMQACSAVATVEGARSQASSKLSYFNITSPIDGICTIRSTQPGELVSAGQVMLTLVSLNSAYMRGFVPEGDIARIKIGQAAQVFLDSDATKPVRPLSGRVTAIDADPSFTPENVYFKKDRVRQAYGIKITIDHANGLAKPGMPAQAKIVLNANSQEKN